MTALLTWWTELTDGEECDRCGAAARLWIVFTSGQDLLLCARHARQHEAALLRMNDVVLRRTP